ncbi:hypothetical protein ABMA27_007661 [Loxostege sticticalis]|uniref:Uncharacterized protein n=1 Tax=Loxostege sticticalis TaxID=481309 RepID=A0ABR3HGM2_LOXSC
MAKTRKKLTEDERKIRRREQKKIVMRRLREKIKRNPVALAEKRKKDREYYYKKKEKGLVKTIKDLPPRDQRKLRKKWREDSKKRREIKKIQRSAQNLLDRETPPPSPASLPSSLSSSRVSSGKIIAARNRRRLANENLHLRHQLKNLERKLRMYQKRDERRLQLEQKLEKENNSQNKESKKKRIQLLKVKRVIQDFLLDDQNSRLTSGKKDTITKNKKKKQIRLLNDSLLNLHKKFVEKTNKKISYKTFCRYRPFWVINPKASDRNTCLCAMHENTDYIVKALKTRNIINENSALEVAKVMYCEGELKEKCMERSCPDCCNKTLSFNQYFPNDSINYYRWITKKSLQVVKGREKMCQKTIKEEVQTNMKGLTDLLKLKMPVYMTHVSNMLHQFKIIRIVKNNMKSQSALLHVDFSENYLCKYGTEVQGAHFGGSKAQVSLHTSVLYFKDENIHNKLQHKSFCTISENLRHDPTLICAHLNPVIENIKLLVPNLKSLHFLSDGPLTQYRNKNMFYLLVHYIGIQLNIDEITWHYSESGHGKGAPDGVGGCLKRCADTQVGLGRDICNFKSLVECLQKNVQAVNIIPIADSNISEIENTLSNAELHAFKGTLQIHQLAWHKDDPHLLHARRLSCVECTNDSVCKHYEIGQIHVNTKLFSGILEDLSPEPPTYSPHFNMPSTSTGKRKYNYYNIYSSDSDSSEDGIPLTQVKDKTRAKEQEEYDSSDESIF